ncbi:hypothetical protein CR203_14815 [Salipaludibacillus neizhouensis]|uniref:Major facilitator superfamily (MFS) profile domain-containing protein n=1 Tax=Salipaludibacillus neizhouensis TaxID=885475 RepID=A0A3A9K5B7_9BACI|nr:MFS transporter [Salipaludibacillus neizhouensis]RKL66558.1 hypothetical protein CR203_14815 [Salipaludibacillus neizhouensis]
MYLKVLKNTNILNYLLGAGVSNTGNVIAGLGFLFLAYELTGSSLYTTGVVISQAAPYLLFGLIGGVIADWTDKKTLLIWIELIRVPIVLSLVLFYRFEILNYWHLVSVSFIIQRIGCFYNPAHRAILPMITIEEERTTANSLLDTVTRGGTKVHKEGYCANKPFCYHFSIFDLEHSNQDSFPFLWIVKVS